MPTKLLNGTVKGWYLNPVKARYFVYVAIAFMK